jgi:uncharacterized protein (DUF2252 family)
MQRDQQASGSPRRGRGSRSYSQRSKKEERETNRRARSRRPVPQHKQTAGTQRSRRSQRRACGGSAVESHTWGIWWLRHDDARSREGCDGAE